MKDLNGQRKREENYVKVVAISRRKYVLKLLNYKLKNLTAMVRNN